jgi:two-component system phosphate regulon sensor histidine kinase PhoR
VQSLRLRLAYFMLVPALLVAAGVLSYYTYQTASQVKELGEKSIASSSLLLVQDRVDRLEHQIIATDHQVFQQLDPGEPLESCRSWKRQAEALSPSVRAVLILDSRHQIIGYAARATEEDKAAFRTVWNSVLIRDLKLEGLSYGALKHLHATYADKNYLISYTAVRHNDENYFFAAHHDSGYLVRNVFPELFRLDANEQWVNVADRDGKRVFGESLAEAGDYVVSRRFPTTLYMWHLQVAPRLAPLLKAKTRSSHVSQVGLVGVSLAIILVAIFFILFAASRERRVADLKSEFIANVSHELKTPLSVIRMFAEMLLTNRVRDEGKREEYLGIICSESERLTALIENVLDFASLERGKRRYEMQNTNLAELVRRAIDAARYRFEREGTDVRLRLSGVEPTGRCDDQAILLAVVNLLDNALKYGNHSPIEVAVETSNDQIRISVRDRGPGIPPQDLKRVFERFFRAETSGKTRGSGIGLAIVKRIAEDHGGRAWAQNATDGGAIVGFTIPHHELTRPLRLDEAAGGATPPGVDSAPAVDIVARHG